jgi:phosphoglycerol transferase
VKETYRSDADFVRRVEALLQPVAGSGPALVYQMPYNPFPEGPLVTYGMRVYDHLRGYLHSRRLHWSSGAMKGRESDAWQKALASQPVDVLCRCLSAKGFAGIYVDRYGYADGAIELERQLSYMLGPPAVVSSNKRLCFYELSNYRRKALPVDTQSARR